jgi:hypothetical protein
MLSCPPEWKHSWCVNSRPRWRSHSGVPSGEYRSSVAAPLGTGSIRSPAKVNAEVTKPTHGEVSIGGTTDDFGAGRLVRGEVQGVRVLAHPGPVVVVDTREPSSVSLR